MKIAVGCTILSMQTWKYNNYEQQLISIRFLEAAIMKITILWDVKQCSPLQVHRRLDQKYCFSIAVF
jgi:hypothetical protein